MWVICKPLFWVLIAVAAMLAGLAVGVFAETISITFATANATHDPATAATIAGIVRAGQTEVNFVIGSKTDTASHEPMAAPTFDKLEYERITATATQWMDITAQLPALTITFGPNAGWAAASGRIGGTFTVGRSRLRLTVTATCASGHTETQQKVVTIV